MNIQQFNSKIISITQLRRDIDVLEKTLRREDEAIIMRNQDILFVAISPNRYKELQGTRRERTTQAVKEIDKLRTQYKFSGQPVTEYLIKMRDERVRKWTSK